MSFKLLFALIAYITYMSTSGKCSGGDFVWCPLEVSESTQLWKTSPSTASVHPPRTWSRPCWRVGGRGALREKCAHTQRIYYSGWGRVLCGICTRKTKIHTRMHAYMHAMHTKRNIEVIFPSSLSYSDVNCSQHQCSFSTGERQECDYPRAPPTSHPPGPLWGGHS